MPVYKLGLLIRARREMLGYTQEELAEGICSLPTMSRIENGERLPTKENAELLLQRLGYSDMLVDSYADEDALILNDLKYKIRQAIILEQPAKIGPLLEEFEKIADLNNKSVKQFVMLCRTIPLGFGADTLEVLEEAMRLTCPRYRPDKLPKLLTFEEIILVNNIAICYYGKGKPDVAIKMFYSLKTYYENNEVNMEERLRTQPMVLYNLSKCLGASKRYDECVEICDLGIQLARESGKCNCLDRMFYNRAYVLLNRDKPGDREEAKKYAELALHTAAALARDALAAHYKQFIDKNFPE
ncbi:MAG: helix-turn-helix transcriptional regulator [Clostridia bacterium]|nr:helix-turn-helix transcriptional regulator [Clostridia bacterium]